MHLLNIDKMIGKRNFFLTILLAPLALLYNIIVSLRNFLFDTKILHSKEFAMPIITIGNITVGGTGKTPHIEYLVRLLRKNFKIATLSRGYKRKTSGFVLATTESLSTEIGDEPKQIKQKFPKIPVAVDGNRVRGIRKLLKQYPKLNAILLDDAFQHRYVEPGLSILLVDYNRPIFEDKILPLGTLRESISQKRRAKIVIVTKTPAEIKPIEQRIFTKNLELYPYQKVYYTKLIYGAIIPVFKSAGAKPSDFPTLKKQKPQVLLITGIARTKVLVEYIQENISTKITHLEYPDHHPYRSKELNQIIDAFKNLDDKNIIVLTTEKDAMRLNENDFLDDNFKSKTFYLPIEIAFINDDHKKFDKQIKNFVEHKKSNDQMFMRIEANKNDN